MRMDGSVGLTLRMVGGAGRFLGSCPPAAEMAVSTSCAALSILRLRSNCSVICVWPRTLVDVSWLTLGISANWYSSGAATEDAIVSGEAPGNDAETLMVGKSTCGSGATGSMGKATSPINKIAAINSDVAIGRLMKGAEIFIGGYFRVCFFQAVFFPSYLRRRLFLPVYLAVIGIDC